MTGGATSRTTTERVPHGFEDDPDAPGCCRRCRLIRTNQIHDLSKITPTVQKGQQ